MPFYLIELVDAKLVFSICLKVLGKRLKIKYEMRTQPILVNYVLGNQKQFILFNGVFSFPYS